MIQKNTGWTLEYIDNLGDDDVNDALAVWAGLAALENPKKHESAPPS